MEAPGRPLTTSQEFYARNDTLARAYLAARPTVKTRILGELYTLTWRLFQAWRLAKGEREDFRQEACLYLARALETYKPDKGPFVAWLKFYCQHALEGYGRLQDLSADALPATLAAPTPETPDPLFWTYAKKSCTQEEWVVLLHRFQEVRTLPEIAEKTGLSVAKIQKLLSQALTKLKCASFTTPNHTVSHKNLSTNDLADSTWIGKKDLCARLSLRQEQLRWMLNPRISAHYSPCMIDPRDVVRLPRVRIRFLETDAGLIYPRILRRPPTRPRASLP